MSLANSSGHIIYPSTVVLTLCYEDDTLLRETYVAGVSLKVPTSLKILFRLEIFQELHC